MNPQALQSQRPSLVLLKNSEILSVGAMSEIKEGIVTIVCRNDELSWLFTNRLGATRYMKVNRMGITEILRRICQFSANKIKISESH